MTYTRILAFIFSCSIAIGLPAQVQRHIRQYSMEDGIPSHHINAVCQDSLGFMWIASNEGLTRFDGRDFITINLAEISPQPLLSKSFNQIMLDRNHDLWISGNGLIHYQHLTGKIEFFFHDDNDSGSLINDGTHGLYEDQNGNIWIGSWKGISMYDPVLKKFTNYPRSGDWIMSICEDAKGNMWFGTLNGRVYRLDLHTNEFKTYQHDPLDPRSIGERRVQSIKRDKNGKLWLSSWQGLNLYNEKTDDFTHYYPNPYAKVLGLDRNNQINSLVLDSTCIWLGTENGVLSFDLRTKQFSMQGKMAGPGINIIYSLYKDRNQGIWMCTFGSGLRYFNLNDKIFTNVIYGEKKYDEKSIVSAIYEGRDDNLFLVSQTNIFYWDRKRDLISPYKYKSILYQSDDKSFITFDSSRLIFTKPYFPDTEVLSLTIGEKKDLPAAPLSISQDASGKYWILYKRSFQLTSFNPKTGAIKHYSLFDFFPKDFRRTDIIRGHADQHGHLYLMYWGVLVKLNLKDWSFKKFEMNKNGMRSLASYSIVEEENGNLWLAGDDGLEMYDAKTDQFSIYDKKDGLPISQTLKVIQDKLGKIWITTTFGLSRFDPLTKKFLNFSKQDGLQGNYFTRAAIMTVRGEMAFGGEYGITLFDPANLRENTTRPPIVITVFKIFNKEIKPGKDSPLHQDIINTKEIKLNYNQSGLSFEFIALNYLNPEKNQYAYKMEGFEDDWNYIGSKNTAIYTNLNPGEYTFRVIASNNDGIWNEKGTSLKIVILPPFWQTWWFRTMMVLLIIAIIVTIFMARTRQLEMKKRELTKLVEERTLKLRESNALLEERQKEIIAQKEVLEVQADKLKVLNSTKDKFFSIIGHDLKNPIAGINSLTSILKADEIVRNPKEGMKIINLIADSSRNAFSLLKNLLTWSQSQSEGLRANPLNLDLYWIIEESMQLLQVNAEKKQIKIVNEVEPNSIIYADLNMITTVIRNLLSNAIKFTENNGTVKISCSVKDQLLEIAITDTGIGMDEKTMDKLFKIDQQLTSKGTSGEGGTGLGLIICKEFVERNNGTVSVKSTIGKGSIFTITIPVGNGPVSDLQQLKEMDEEFYHQPNEEDDRDPVLEKYEEQEVKVFMQNIKKEEQIILIIEDIPEIRFNIKKSLEPYFKIEEAENGKIGLQKANEILPDLIISDIVMPEMNGFDTCTFLKSGINTSHIPVILLTSRSSDNSQLTGLSIGADDYITKPFKPEFLLARIRNLIIQRDKLKEKFSREFIVTPTGVIASNTEEQFLGTAIGIIEKHLDNPEFTVTEFAKEIGMSQTQLYRKLEALTGQAPVIFIRSIRLKKAAQYLLNSEMNVNEIATIVGFNNMSYFSKSFKDQFGMLPKQYSLKGSL